MRTLADLIKFNLAHCQQEMKYFGQEVFDLAEQTTGLGDPVYLDARALCLEKTRSQGIDKVIADRARVHYLAETARNPMSRRYCMPSKRMRSTAS